MSTRLVVMVLRLCLAGVAAVSIAPATASYTFTKIQAGGGPLLGTPFPDFQNPIINSSGAAAFLNAGSIFVSDGQASVERVFVGESASGSTIASLSAPGGFNVNGVIAFYGSLADGRFGVFVDSALALTGVADNTGVSAAFSGRPRLNDVGVVAWSGILDSNVRAILSGDVSATALIADSSGPYRLLGTPSINSGGQIAFPVFFDDLVTSAIVVVSGNATATYASYVGSSVQLGSVSINDSGKVTFSGALPSGERGIFLADGNAVTPVALSATDFVPIASSINGLGQVLFQAHLGQGPGFVHSGIFLVTNNDIAEIIRSGDSLEGLEITGLGIADGGALNDKGSFVFVAARRDALGLQVVDLWRADRALTVPEPATLLLAVLGLAGLGLIQRNRFIGNITLGRFLVRTKHH